MKEKEVRMEAKDTVMSVERITKVRQDAALRLPYNAVVEILPDVERLAKAQAEISFKMGYQQALKDIEAGTMEIK